MRREPQTVCGGHGGCDLELVQRTSAFVERMDRGLVRAGYVGHLPARASYIDRIFKGANPAELPAQAPTKFEFAINLKTATTLGLTVPPTVIALAPGWMKRVRTWCGRHGGRCCLVRASL
jgi:hypothetical protein